MRKNKVVVMLVLLLSIGNLQVKAQNVAINSTGAAPANCAMLDISSANTGLLIPRVALTNVAVYAPLIGIPVDGMIVYSSAAPTGGNGTGYYYWSTATNIWINLTDNLAPGNPWYVNGNTLGGTEFIGSLNAQPFIMKTNGLERLRVDAAGDVGIGLTVPAAQLDVISSAGTHAFYAHTPNTGAYVGYETAFTFGNPVQSISGAGIWSANPLAGYTSMFSQSTGAASVAASINYSNVWMASYNYVENSTVVYNPSVIYAQLNNSGTTLGGFQNAIVGLNNRATTAGNAGYSVGVEGVSLSQNQDAFGVVGYAYCNTSTRAGGYFEADNYAGALQGYAYVGTTVGAVSRKITGTASVSEIIPTSNHGRITMTCPESPEYWYQDYGTVKLVNGKAHVDLDPILADIIFVNDSNPIRVFCTPVDMLDYNGVAIINRTASGFDIVEVNEGTHSGKLDYQLVAKPKTGYGEGRFPQAPGPAGLKAENEPLKAKANNQPNPSNVFHWPADNVVYGYELKKQTPVPATKTPIK